MLTKNDASLKYLRQLYNFKHLIKVPTFYKNQGNSLVINLMLTKSHCSFHNSRAIETGLSDFHKMTVIACI